MGYLDPILALDAVGASDDPLIVTPGFTLDRMNRLNAAMTTFQQDVWRELPGDKQPFSLAFGAFKAEWDKFYVSNGPGVSGWLSRGWGSTMDAVTNYEKRLDEWKSKFRELVKAKGGSVTAPSADPVSDPTRPQKDEDGKLPSWVWPAAAVVGVGALGFGVYKILLAAAPIAVGRYLPRGAR